MAVRTGGRLTLFTVMVIVSKSLRFGEPSSVTVKTTPGYVPA
jgi:hypothetical protein